MAGGLEDKLDLGGDDSFEEILGSWDSEIFDIDLGLILLPDNTILQPNN